MKTIRFLTLLAVASSISLPALAQKRKVAPIRKQLASQERVEPDSPPQFNKFGYLVRLSANGKARIEMLSADTAVDWTVPDFSIVASKSSSPSIIVLSPDPRINYKSLQPWLNELRGRNEPRLKLRFDDGLEILVPPQMPVNFPLRPNPLFLLTGVGESGGLKLNGMDLGSLGNPSIFTEKLKEVFKARVDNGIFRIGEAEIDTTVFIQPTPTMTVAEVERLARLIREAGSDRICIALQSNATTVHIGSNERID